MGGVARGTFGVGEYRFRRLSTQFAERARFDYGRAELGLTAFEKGRAEGDVLGPGDRTIEQREILDGLLDENAAAG